MNLRPWLLAGVLAMVVLPAAAAVPTDDQVVRLQRMMGFEGAIEKVITDQFGEQPVFVAMKASQRACLLGEMTPMMAGQMSDAFKDLFGDEQTASEWLAFADTAGGRKLMSFVQAGVQASMDGKPAPTPEAALGDMNAEEMGDMMTFMATPAAKVLERDFPALKMADAELETFMVGAMARCGIAE